MPAVILRRSSRGIAIDQVRRRTGARTSAGPDNLTPVGAEVPASPTLTCLDSPLHLIISEAARATVENRSLVHPNCFPASNLRYIQHYGRVQIILYYSCLIGAGEWTRTTDLLITNQLLCQLSYTGPLPSQGRDYSGSARGRFGAPMLPRSELAPPARPDSEAMESGWPDSPSVGFRPRRSFPRRSGRQQ